MVFSQTLIFCLFLCRLHCWNRCVGVLLTPKISFKV